MKQEYNKHHEFINLKTGKMYSDWRCTQYHNPSMLLCLWCGNCPICTGHSKHCKDYKDKEHV